MNPSEKRTLALLATTQVVGIVLACAPLVGMAMSAFGLRKAFQTLGTSGIGDPGQLSAAIGEILIPCVVSLPVALVGAIMILASTFALRSREHLASLPQPPPLPPG